MIHPPNYETTGEDILRQARVRPAVSVQDQEEWLADSVEAGFQEKDPLSVVALAAESSVYWCHLRLPE